MSRRASAITGGLVGLMLGGILLLVALMTGLLTPNVGGLVSLSPDMVAKRIAFELQDQKISATVDCPKTITAPIGFSFVCMVNTPEGNVARAQVTIVNVIGDINWWLTSDLPENMS